MPASHPVESVPHTPALLRAALDLSSRLLTLESAARRVRRSKDDEAVHDFRVASRRLTAALDLWAPLLEAHASALTRRRVRRMRRELSPARDIEVVGDRLRERLKSAPDVTRIVLEDRIARLDRRRATLMRRAPEGVARARILRVRRGLLRAVRRSPAPAAHLRVQDLVRERIAATRGRALATLNEAWARRDDESMHEARVRIKAWRYAAEVTSAATEGSPSLADLRAVQQSLGDVQDLAVTIRDLQRQARRALRRDRPALAATLEALVEELAAEKSRAAAEAQRRATTLSVVAVRGRAAEA